MYGIRYPHGATREEMQALFQIRLETLQDATSRAAGGQPVPISWRAGWKAVLKLLRRDPDGSLCARITVTGPHASSGYVRNVRLVKEHRVKLNQSSTLARGNEAQHTEKR